VLHRSTAPSPLDWTPLQRCDLQDLHALLTVIEEADDLGDRHTLDDLVRSFERADADPQQHCRLGRDRDGVLVGYGWNHPLTGDDEPCRVHVSGGVHPDHRGRGAGHALLAWQLEAARQWYLRSGEPTSAPLQMIAYADERCTDQRALYEDLGLHPVRWYADMTRSLQGPLPPHVDPPGIRVVPLNRKRFEAVRQAHNEAFAGHWGSRPVDAERWEKQLVRPESRLSWSWVALAAETSEVVGYATNAAYEDDWAEQGFSEGWTDRLGVRPGWRNRGVARALLTASMLSFAEAGLAAAGVGVDCDAERALDLYEELGYRSTHTVVMYGRTEEALTGEALIREVLTTEALSSEPLVPEAGRGEALVGESLMGKGLAEEALTGKALDGETQTVGSP
jgi:mycothiol synthase